MIQIELSAKMLHFLIEAVEHRVAEFDNELSKPSLDDNAQSDIGNDVALLKALNADLKRREVDWANRTAPIGDVRARMKLRLIMQCLLTDGFSEEEQNIFLEMGRSASPDPVWTDYLYWPERYKLDGSIEQALDKAFAYRPIILPSDKN